MDGEVYADLDTFVFRYCEVRDSQLYRRSYG